MSGKRGKVNIMKKIIIISAGLFMILPVFIFSIFFLYVIGRLINNIDFSENKDSEVSSEYPKIDELSNSKIYYDNMYKGEIEKIEDNKIYFIVDRKGKKWGGITTVFKDVEDFEVIFDIDTYTLEYDPFDKGYTTTIDKDTNLAVFHTTHYDGDYLTYDHKNYYSVKDLEFLVGNYLRVDESMTEYFDYGVTNKFLSFSIGE